MRMKQILFVQDSVVEKGMPKMWKKFNKKLENTKKFLSKYKTPTNQVSSTVQTNFDTLTNDYFQKDDDVVYFPIQEKYGIAYIDTIVNEKKINEIIDYLNKISTTDQSNNTTIHKLPIHYTTESEFEKIVQSMTEGRAVLFINDETEAIVINIQEVKERALEEPSVEATIKGPREGFIENFKTNLSLIRRRIQHHKLKIEKLRVGSLSQTNIALLYIDGLANDQIVDEVRRRIKQIEVDAIQSSNQINAFIRDHRYSIVPLVGSTERPDRIAANILEGKVAIVVDGTPFVLYGPVNMFSLLQSADDYYDSTYIASLLRLIRFAALFVSLLLPSLYIALTTYHHEMIPTALALSIAAGRETIPFPALIETLFIEVIFEFLREAGLRLPKAIGNTISIVGALVIGDAAVRAGFVSPLVVIIVSVTAISSFIIPSYSLGIAFRILRFVFIFLAATFGFFGIVWGLMILYLHLTSLRSFGYPYLAPHAPFIPNEMRDTIFRFPLFKQNNYPKFTVEEPTLKRFPKPNKTKERWKKGGE